MAWNEPGGNRPRDPWGGGGNDQGPPDLDEALRKLQDKLNQIFGGGNSKNSPTPSSGLVPLFIIIAVAVFVIATGFKQINEQERGIVLRLGVYSRTLDPGLHWTWPLLEDVAKVNATRLRLHTTQGLMLTEDENIVSVELSVQYKVADPKSFVLAVREPEISLQEATESALRHVVGSSEMHQVLTEGRERIAYDVQARLQDYLNAYHTGIQVTKVNVENTEPPKEVQASFDDVIKAREDEVRAKNEAEAYANQIIPEARGRSKRIEQEASAYRDQVISRAEGEAKRFDKLYEEYQKAPAVMRQRLYLDAVQYMMANSSKVLMDVKSNNNLVVLPLEKMLQSSSSSASSASNSPLAPPPIRDLTDTVAEQLRQDTSTRHRDAR